MSSDVFVRDRLNGDDRRQRHTAGSRGTVRAPRPSISDDGRYVAFTSTAPNLVAGDTNNATDVFVRDRVASTTTRVSVSSSGMQSPAASGAPSISGGGGLVAFVSATDALVIGDTNNVSDVFVRDRSAATTTRASLSNGGAQANGASIRPTLSDNGSTVAFSSAASNLVAGDTNRATDVFVRDRISQTTERASLSARGTQANGRSAEGAISGDGRNVSFTSAASNLVVGDTNRAADVFLRARDGVPSTDLCGGWPTSTLRGTASGDQLVGSEGGDVIVALAGNDQITDQGGTDLICGDEGADTITAGAGDDAVNAGDGADVVLGGLGRDRIAGLAGGDRLRGGSASDTLPSRRWAPTSSMSPGRRVPPTAPGDDILDGRDGLGGDVVNGGAGSDICLTDPGDTRTNCAPPLSALRLARMTRLSLGALSSCFAAPAQTALWPLVNKYAPHPVRGGFNDPRGGSLAHFGVDIQALDQAPAYAMRGGALLGRHSPRHLGRGVSDRPLRLLPRQPASRNR